MPLLSRFPISFKTLKTTKLSFVESRALSYYLSLQKNFMFKPLLSFWFVNENVISLKPHTRLNRNEEVLCERALSEEHFSFKVFFPNDLHFLIGNEHLSKVSFCLSFCQVSSVCVFFSQCLLFLIFLFFLLRFKIFCLFATFYCYHSACFLCLSVFNACPFVSPSRVTRSFKNF